jgi:beta-glucosidase
VTYREGLEIGYRFYDAHDLTPLFPFGFGLSYTRFRLSDFTVKPTSGGDAVEVTAANTGRRVGTETVQCYLSFPATAGEPPLQLRAFASVTLRAGGRRTVELGLDQAAFEIYLNGHFVVPDGEFTVYVGTSSARLPLSAQVDAPAA